MADPLEDAEVPSSPIGDQLVEQLYTRLRGIADRRLRALAPGQTLQPTALVHEAYMKLGSDGWESRTMFLSAAARAIRNVLVDHMRGAGRQKRGGDLQRVTLSVAEAGPSTEVDLLALEDSLLKLEQVDPRGAELVRLRFFAGMTIEEAAEALAVSVPTAKRDWRFARGWLQVELHGEVHGEQSGGLA